MANKILTREMILSAKDIFIQEVEVPEWGGSVYVKTLSGKQRDILESTIMEFSASGKPKKMRLDKVRSTVAALGICDADGNQLFKEDDIPALANKSAAALDKVVSKIQDMASMSANDVENLIGELKNDQPAALPIG